MIILDIPYWLVLAMSFITMLFMLSMSLLIFVYALNKYDERRR